MREALKFKETLNEDLLESKTSRPDRFSGCVRNLFLGMFYNKSWNLVRRSNGKGLFYWKMEME